ncbi:hypothetical protein N234_03290 [Ralstonia pickettii DTP0602]|nr:hypothetical protein N234_03290 [Ralstonia pickettii DTP0602]
MTIRLQKAVGMPPALADPPGGGRVLTHAQLASTPSTPSSPPSLHARPGGPLHFARPTLLLETLLATRLELLSRDQAWPPHTLARRQAVLMQLWQERPPGLFEHGGTAESIARCLHAAFAEAAAGRRLEAAQQFKRAYYLVCCTASAGTRVRLRAAPAASGYRA